MAWSRLFDFGIASWQGEGEEEGEGEEVEGGMESPSAWSKNIP